MVQASFSPSPKELRNVSLCALGELEPDLVIRGDLLDVYTGEVLVDHLVAVKGKWIAWVGPRRSLEGGKSCTFLDLKNYILIPGFVDAHAHLGTYLRPDYFLEASLPTGTTTVVTELIDVAFKLSYDAVSYTHLTLPTILRV